MRLWDDNIRLLIFALRFIYSVLQMLACFFMVFDSQQFSQLFNEAIAHNPLRGATKTTPNATKNVTGRKIGVNLLPSLSIFRSALGGVTYVHYSRAYVTYSGVYSVHITLHTPSK